MNQVLSNKRLYAKEIPDASKLKNFGGNFSFGTKTSAHAGKTNLSVGVVFLIIVVLILGGFYLYQVNKVVSQGFEMKEAENQIQELGNENKKLKIKEVELKSMYNIEKSTENLNLVNADSVSYVEMDGPVAMK